MNFTAGNRKDILFNRDWEFALTDRMDFPDAETVQAEADWQNPGREDN